MLSAGAVCAETECRSISKAERDKTRWVICLVSAGIFPNLRLNLGHKLTVPSATPHGCLRDWQQHSYDCTVLRVG